MEKTGAIKLVRTNARPLFVVFEEPHKEDPLKEEQIKKRTITAEWIGKRPRNGEAAHYALSS